MKKTIFFIILLIMALTSIFLSIKNSEKFELVKKELTQNNNVLIQKNQYLKRCLDYNSIINKNDTQKYDKKIIIYYSGNACFACCESLMKLIKNKYNLVNETSILVDSPQKKDAIVSFNDSYNTNYKCKITSENILGSYELNDILVIYNTNNQTQILEYKPEEEYIFNEYFKKLKF